MFFYGTLKRGQSNHDRFCQEALRVEPPAATTLSHLYELPFRVSRPLRLWSRRAVGTTDYLADAEKQREAPPAPLASAPAWDLVHDLVHSELLTFEDPERRLRAFDALEGYPPARIASTNGCLSLCTPEAKPF
jgi:gamma-glutamylcyclotransferase (GGCT)/AIG2-like uncharacterized protein YtfP